jgi:hypothetical protein
MSRFNRRVVPSPRPGQKKSIDRPSTADTRIRIESFSPVAVTRSSYRFAIQMWRGWAARSRRRLVPSTVRDRSGTQAIVAARTRFRVATFLSA